MGKYWKWNFSYNFETTCLVFFFFMKKKRTEVRRRSNACKSTIYICIFIYVCTAYGESRKKNVKKINKREKNKCIKNEKNISYIRG